MTEDDDAFDFEGADVAVNGNPIGRVEDFDISIASDFDPADVANTSIRSHQDKIFEAVESAAWHTLIDGAGHEVFPPDFRPKYMREVIHRLETEGYAGNDDTAFYAGSQAFDAVVEHMDSIAQDAPDFDFERHSFDGYSVHESPTAPEGVILFVDANALFRVPPEVIARQVGPGTSTTVSSPIGVRDGAGVAVVNIDLTDD